MKTKYVHGSEAYKDTICPECKSARALPRSVFCPECFKAQEESNRQLSQKMLMYYDKKAKEMNRHGQHITS